MRSVSAVVLAALALTIVSCSGEEQAQGPTEQMVDVGTHRLRLRTAGSGGPPVIIDVGLGDRSENWRPVIGRLSGSTTVCTYDRAGYGESDIGSFPRDSRRVADELHAALRRAPVPGPYVLVGHSIGGLNVQAFADAYPDDVAGLVLLDPPPLSWIAGDRYPGLREMAEGMTAEWQTMADRGESAEDAGERREAAYFRTLASEHREMFGESARTAAGIESFGDLPLVVVASGVPNPMFGDVAEEYQEFWIDESRELSTKSSRGEFVLAGESTHNVYADNPELVIESILAVVAGAR